MESERVAGGPVLIERALPLPLVVEPGLPDLEHVVLARCRRVVRAVAAAHPEVGGHGQRDGRALVGRLVQGGEHHRPLQEGDLVVQPLGVVHGAGE